MIPVTIDRARLVVLMIDLQKGYCDVAGDAARILGWDCAPMHDVCERHCAFLDNLRHIIPPDRIIWTRMEEHEDTLAPNLPVYPDAGPRRFCVRGTPGFDYHIVAPVPGEVEILKFHLSAFHKDAHIRIIGQGDLTFPQTDPQTSAAIVPLDAYLQQKGIDTIVFTGVFASRCVYANIIGASSLGYHCLCLSDLAGVPAGAFFDQERTTHDLTQNMLYSYTASSRDFLAALRDRDDPRRIGGESDDPIR